LALANLEEKNDPIPDPHADKLFAAAVVDIVVVVVVLPLATGITPVTDAADPLLPFSEVPDPLNDDNNENGLEETRDFGESTKPCPA
jgi:hypothetical protein